MDVDFTGINLAQSFLLLRLYTDDTTYTQIDKGRDAKEIYNASVKLLRGNLALWKVEWVAVALDGKTRRILLVTRCDAFPFYVDSRESFAGKVSTQRFCTRAEALKIYKDLVRQNKLCSTNAVRIKDGI